MEPSHHYDGSVLIAPKCEARFFDAYRKEHPEERFKTLSYEEVCECFRFDLAAPWPESVPLDLRPYLLCMTANHYKSEPLQKLLPLAKQLESDGVLRRKSDPSRLFCGKPIIIRGYYGGTAISEALQDLPNISLNWDIRRNRLNEAEAPRQKCVTLGDAFLHAEFEIERLMRHGVDPKDIYLRYDGLLPETSPLNEAQIFHGPYVPSGAVVVYIESPKEEIVPDLLDPASLAELHLPTRETKARREKEDESCFNRYSLLRARFYATAPF